MFEKEYFIVQQWHSFYFIFGSILLLLLLLPMLLCFAVYNIAAFVVVDAIASCAVPYVAVAVVQ